ncbi:TolC family protein [Aurantiacibacter xanthus]|nr:TolC family protein [Aurantiacibacter xanthus]
MLAPAGASAQSGITYDAARIAAQSSDPSTQAADLSLSAAEDNAAALDNLYRPTVTAAASVIAYQKTLSVDLSGAKADVMQQTGQFLAGLPGQFPPEFSALVSAVAGRIESALPGLIGQLPDQLDYTARDTIVRPTLSAVMPLYTGGALEAVSDAARGGVTIAQGRRQITAAAQEVSLVQRYFGLQLARNLRASAEERLAASERHLSSAQAMESAGILPHSAVLDVTVLRDAAQRSHDRAVREESLAVLSLERMLGRSVDALATPLFVNTGPLPPLARFQNAAEANGTGQTSLARGQQEVAQAGERLARAARRPRAFAFGAYSVDPTTNLPTEPDWVVGATVSYTLISPVDRGRLADAARTRSAAAAADQRAAADRVAGEIERAHAMADSARRSFLSMDSSVAAAQENLRLQEIAFHEGVGTVDRLMAAQAALASAESERAAAAYEYDVSLAALLAASGAPQDMSDYARREDRVTVDGK